MGSLGDVVSQGFTYKRSSGLRSNMLVHPNVIPVSISFHFQKLWKAGRDQRWILFASEAERTIEVDWGHHPKGSSPPWCRGLTLRQQNSPIGGPRGLPWVLPWIPWNATVAILLPLGSWGWGCQTEQASNLCGVQSIYGAWWEGRRCMKLANSIPEVNSWAIPFCAQDSCSACVEPYHARCHPLPSSVPATCLHHTSTFCCLDPPKEMGMHGAGEAVWRREKNCGLECQTRCSPVLSVTLAIWLFPLFLFETREQEKEWQRPLQGTLHSHSS